MLQDYPLLSKEPPDIGINQPRDDDEDDVKSKYKPILDELAGPDGGSKGRRLASFWMERIIECDDDRDFKQWLKRATTIEKRYRDQRNRVDEEGQRRVNSLWANIEILTPALYGKCPVPVCERRFKDKDPTGRGAAQILERALRNEIEICGFDESIRQALRDYLLAGRGVVWVRYEPIFDGGPSIPTDSEMDISDELGNIIEEPKGDEEELWKLRETGIRVIRESTPVDFIQWTDFYTFPARARIWKEVTAVGKRVYMTREQMKRRFGNKIGSAIPFQKDDRKTRRQEDTRKGHEVDEKAQVYEIWDKSQKEVIWVAEGYEYLCDRKDDPLQLEHFFPCPKPLYSNTTNNTLIPVPDFIQYQDQALQIDELTQRINMLAKACKVAGVYNAAAKGIQRLFNESVENEMIPVDDWAAFAEKGGVAGNLSFIPLKEIMGVIEELTKIKERAVAEMDRLTGINDVMRGVAEDDRETLGGKRLKAAASGTRLQHRQDEVARFATDVLRIMADVMCRHFSTQSLIEVSGALYEEGLGTMDIPEEDMLQSDLPDLPGQKQDPPDSGPPQVPPMGGPFSGGKPGGVPPGLQGPGAPQGMPPQGLPMPPGGDGVPGGPPGAGPQMGGGPMPPGGQLPMLGQPPQPGQPPGQKPPMGFQGPMPGPQQKPQPYPPQIMDKLIGLQRIARGIKLLRNERLLGFRVSIEIESTVYADRDKEKGDRTAFLASVTQFLQQSMQISMMMPQASSFLAKLLQFGVRGFNVGRELEQAIEDFADNAEVFAKERAENQPPNPQMLKAQADMLKAQSDMQSSKFKIQSDQQKAAAEVQRQQIENQGEQQNAMADMQQKQADMEMRKMEMEMEKIRLQIELVKAQADLKKSMVDSQTAQQQGAIDQQLAHMDLASQQQKMHMQSAQDEQKMQMQREQMGMQREQHAHDRMIAQQDASLGQQKAYQDAAMQQRQFSHDMQMSERDHAMAGQKQAFDMEQARQQQASTTAQNQHQMDMQRQQQRFDRQNQQGQFKLGQQKLAAQKIAANRPRTVQ